LNLINWHRPWDDEIWIYRLDGSFIIGQDRTSSIIYFSASSKLQPQSDPLDRLLQQQADHISRFVINAQATSSWLNFNNQGNGCTCGCTSPWAARDFQQQVSPSGSVTAEHAWQRVGSMARKRPDRTWLTQSSAVLRFIKESWPEQGKVKSIKHLHEHYVRTPHQIINQIGVLDTKSKSYLLPHHVGPSKEKFQHASIEATKSINTLHGQKIGLQARRIKSREVAASCVHDSVRFKD
jgi:hypothetical protein